MIFKGHILNCNEEHSIHHGGETSDFLISLLKHILNPGLLITVQVKPKNLPAISLYWNKMTAMSWM